MTDVLEIERLGWNEALHPRQGGKFAPKGTASGKAAAPAGKSRMGGGHGGGSEGLSFNGRTGAGYGKKGGDNRVSALQSELNRLGFADGSGKALKKDGKLGPRTTAAIKRAQKALGLKADGIATPRLLAKLKAGKKTVAHKSGGHRKSMPVRPRAGKAAPAGKNPVPTKKMAAPVKRPTFAKQSSPPPAAKKTGPVKRDVSRAAFLSYSVRMTEALRHQPGGHNQQSHANRLGRPSNVPGKTGLAKVAGKLKDDPEQGPAVAKKARPLTSYSARRDAVKGHAKLSRKDFDALPSDEQSAIIAELKQAADALDQHSSSDGMGIKTRGRAAHVTDAQYELRKFTKAQEALPDSSPSGRLSRLREAKTENEARNILSFGVKKADLEAMAKELGMGYSSSWKLEKFKDEVAKRAMAKVETPKTRKLSHTDVRTALVGEDAHIGKSASRKVEDHRALLMDAGASREHADEILKDLGANIDRDYETFDAGYATYGRVDNEKKTAAIEARKAQLAGATPAAFARLLGTDGQPALVKSKPVARVFEAMQAAGWTITGAGHGSYTFQSPDESKTINVIAINAVKIYDDRHNTISGVKALAYVQGGP